MKRLLYIHDYPFCVSPKGHLHYEVGMPESYFDRFVHAGYQIEVFSRIRAVVEKDALGLVDENVRISTFSRSSYIRALFSLVFNRNKFKQFDLVVVNYPSINGLLWLSLFFNNPYILEHVNDNNAFSTKRIGSLVHLYLLMGEKSFFRRAYGVTAVAPYLVSNIYPNKYVVASNVNIRVPAFIVRSPKKPIKVISVGAISKKKGIDLVFDQLRSLDVECHYKIIGQETDLRVNKLIAGLPNNVVVEYLGVLKKEDVWRHLSDADIYVQGSRSEGLPRAVIEAMAYSLPVVASRLPCYEGLIDAEWLIDFREHGALQRVVSGLLQNDTYHRVAKKNYEVSKDYDEAVLKKKKLDFYKEISDALHAY